MSCVDTAAALGHGGHSPPSTGMEEGERRGERRESPEAEYLSSRCVLFTYYRGDISSVVDEHFSRALSSRTDTCTDVPLSSSRRSFPPSFWDCNYPSPSGRNHAEGTVPFSPDLYTAGLHSSLTHTHPHPMEPWGYSQAQAYAPPRPLHELYPPPGLETHYGPLLMPTVRPAHLPTLPPHYDMGKLDGAASWPGLLQPGDVAQTLALNMDPGVWRMASSSTRKARSSTGSRGSNNFWAPCIWLGPVHYELNSV